MYVWKVYTCFTKPIEIKYTFAGRQRKRFEMEWLRIEVGLRIFYGVRTYMKDLSLICESKGINTSNKNIAFFNPHLIL